MNAKDLLVAAVLLVPGAILNYAYPVIANALSVPAGIEFVIVAYCLVVMLVPLRVTEVAGIGIVSGILNILSNPTHVATILGGQAATGAGFMAFFNLVSEPVGILVCFFAFAYLAGKIRAVAPFAAAFAATMASGFMYLLAVLLLNPTHIAIQPGFTGSFLLRVAVAAVLNAIVVQVFFMAAGRPVKEYLMSRSG